MRLSRMSTLAAAVLAVATVSTACGSTKSSTSPGTTGSGPKPSISIGAVNFTENEVLAYVYSDALKAAGFPSSVKPNLGSRAVVEPALTSGAFDATIEYLGNYLSYLNPSVGNLSVTGTVAALQPLVAKKGLSLGAVSQAADSDAIAVTQANATKYHLASIADLTSVASQWAFGGPPECATRITCVQAARIFSSDAVVAQDHFLVLADPKNFQGAGNIIPVVRSGKATPGVLAVLNQVSAALTTADLVQFNLAVSVNHDDPTSVASQFVTAHHLG
jgi:osmoprotectant transport system substrate-binding protein